MLRRRVLRLLFVMLLIVSTVGCGPQAAAPPSQPTPPQPPPSTPPNEPIFALDFSTVPTQVVAKQFAMSDPALMESPAFRQSIVWPRLAAILTHATWSAGWSRSEKLEQLPGDVEKWVHGTSYLNPGADEIAGQWVVIVFGRDKLVIPKGFSGAALTVDEVALFAIANDEPVAMYVRSGTAWIRCSTELATDDLNRYVQAVRKGNAPD